MLEALNKLFENNVISEEVKESIQTAWDNRINENRTQVAEQLREEFATKYEHDKGIMVEALDRMISEQLQSEIREFVEDRKQLAEMKVKYARKMKEDSSLVKEFVSRQLASEIKELHEDRAAQSAKFSKLEEFVVEALAQEITEFFQDKKDLAETKVRMVREGREALEATKKQFIEQASKKVNKLVSEGLTAELATLREDIESARRNDFGRKLFEAFATEYQSSYLNEKSETAKLLKMISMKDMVIKEAAEAVATASKVIDKKEAEVKALKESKNRQAVMGELLAPLNTEQKRLMTELLESVQTNKLQEGFEKYLPAVVAGQSSKKRQALVEAKEITGNKTIPLHEDNNIIDIRRLAGLN